MAFHHRLMVSLSSALRARSAVLGHVLHQNVAASPLPCRVGGPLSVRLMSSIQQQFDQAKDRLNSLKEEPDNDIKLKIYALFKQSSSGKVTSKRPGVMDFVGRAKWDAWNSLGDMSQEDAQKAYINLINELAGAESAAEGSSSEGSSDDQKYTAITVTVKDGLRVITLNRPKKYNSINFEMYLEWGRALKEGVDDPNTVVAAITGAGDFYCAGNDLNNFTKVPEEGPEQFARDMAEVCYNFVDSFISFNKPLVAVVNGPCIGISATTLGLCDAVYASDKAYFHTPFTQLGQSAEGCSSFMFPRIMGVGKAAEMLIFNRKITAAEAHQAGLVAQVFPHDSFQETVWPLVQSYGKLPKQSLWYGKDLYRGSLTDTLREVNRKEVTRLAERWLSDECRKAIIAFLSRKK